MKLSPERTHKTSSLQSLSVARIPLLLSSLHMKSDPVPNACDQSVVGIDLSVQDSGQQLFVFSPVGWFSAYISRLKHPCLPIVSGFAADLECVVAVFIFLLPYSVSLRFSKTSDYCIPGHPGGLRFKQNGITTMYAEELSVRHVCLVSKIAPIYE